MTEIFPNLVKKIDIQIQEAQRVPNKMDIYYQDTESK